MHKKVIAAISTMILLVIPILTITLPKKEFSENENRVLQKFPRISVQDIIDGKFGDDTESYLADHFPMRDRLVSLKSTVQRAIGYKELNGVFVTKDRLIQKIEKPDAEAFYSRVNKLCDNLSDSKVRVNLMVIPTNAQVYSELIPNHAPDIVDEVSFIQEIYDNVSCKTIDVTNQLIEVKNKGNNLYYNLDHHWNLYGAYEGYRHFCNAVGIRAKDIESYQINVVTDAFRGTLYSKVLIDSMKPDSIMAIDLSDEKLTVEYCDKNIERGTYYDDTFLEQKDKYSYFGGGNQALQIITNETAETNQEIVLIKDSFANCFVPFLIPHYKKIHILDTRYYMRHASDYIKEQEGVTDVLILYNIDSLNSNNGIVKIK